MTEQSPPQKRKDLVDDTTSLPVLLISIHDLGLSAHVVTYLCDAGFYCVGDVIVVSERVLFYVFRCQKDLIDALKKSLDRHQVTLGTRLDDETYAKFMEARKSGGKK